MSKARDRKQKANLVTPNVHEIISIGTISHRPMRLAFLVDLTATQEELYSYLAYSSHIWGGRSNFFIPVREGVIEVSWLEVLQRFDPDQVVLCADVKENVLEEIYKTIQPFRFIRWKSEAISKLGSIEDNLTSIPIRDVLWAEFNRIKPVQQTNILIPDVSDNSPFKFFANIQLGRLNNDLVSLYSELLKAKTISLLETVNLSQYLHFVLDFDGKLSPLDCTELYLTSSDHDGWLNPMGPVFILFGGDTFASDLCLFWDLRASIRMFSKGVFALPYNSVYEDVESFAEWCGEKIIGTNSITLASASLGIKPLQDLKDKLRPHLTKRIEGIDIWYDNFAFSPFRIHQAEQSQEIRAEGRKLFISIPKVDPLYKTSKHNHWVVDVSPGADILNYSRYIPCRYEGLNLLLDGNADKVWLSVTGFRIRSSFGYLSLRVTRETERARITIPKDADFFVDYLQSHKLNAHITDKNRYANGMQVLLGNKLSFAEFQQSNYREFFHRLAQGSYLTVVEMNQFLKPGGNGKDHQKAEQFISDLALKGILIRGYGIRCPNCDLYSWYSPAEISERMQCVGCLSEIQPPISAPFHYRLNELFVQGIQQGSIPLLLTLQLLSEMAEVSLLYVLGLEVTDNEQCVDFDILAMCDGYLVAVESKTLENVTTTKGGESIKTQLLREIEFAARIEADVFLITSLADALPDDINDALTEAKTKFPSMTFLVANKTQLEKGSFAGKKGSFQKRIGELIDHHVARRGGKVEDPIRKVQFF